MDLNKIDLEGLPNVDNRLIPLVRQYFSRVMKLNGNPLDYRIETIYNELMSGDLEILVSSKDKNSPDYYEEFPQYARGLFVNEPTMKERAEGKSTKDITRIFIDEHELDAENMKRFSGYEDSRLCHEMEHFIAFRFDGRKRENRLCDYSIIGESATEIGCLYSMFDGNEEKIKDVILQDDDTVLHISYLLRVRLLWAINEAAGHSIVELIEANRNDDFDYFCSIMPKKDIDRISSLYDDFFEGRVIAEIGDQPARVLYDAIEQFKNYMYKNEELYPYLTDQTIDMIDSIFKGYDPMLECKNAVDEQLDERWIIKLRDFDEKELEEIVSEIKNDFPNVSDEEIEYDIFSQLLREHPHNEQSNVIMSCYTGYLKFLESMERVRQNVGDEEFLVLDNFEEFLGEYTYKDGMPLRGRYLPLEQKAIARDHDTGRIRCFKNGNEMSEDDYFYVLLKEHDEIYGDEIVLEGKVIDNEEWEKVSKKILSNSFDEYVPASMMLEKMKHFKEAIRYYSFGKIEELSDEAREFLTLFYENEARLNEEEYGVDEPYECEVKIADIARNALSSDFSESNFASYTSVSYADGEYEKRIEYSKDKGEKI